MKTKKLCNDCDLNLCSDCYESDCPCNLAGHTVAPAQLIKDALVIINPDRPIDLNISAVFCDQDENESGFNLVVNGRMYAVTVQVSGREKE
jgi:hypothetical protein